MTRSLSRRGRATASTLAALAVPALAGVALAAPAAGPAAAAAGAAENASIPMPSVFELVTAGGIMMIPIGIASLIAFAVTVERLIVLRRRRIIPAGVLEQVRPHLPAPGASPAEAVAWCEREGSPVARVIAAGLRRLGQPLDTIERHVAEAGERVSLELRKRLRVLAVIAAIAPLMGLLGTILGMINAFRTVASAGDALGRTELLAEGIYEAMITTAGGLVVAIPALLAYHWLSARVQRLVMEMDAVGIDLVETLVTGGQVGGVAVARPMPVAEIAPAGRNGHVVAAAPAPAPTPAPAQAGSESVIAPGAAPAPSGAIG